MGIVTINTSEVRQQSKQANAKKLPGVSFGDFMGPVGAIAAETVGQKTGNYNYAAMTAATATGIASASSGGNAPYYGGMGVNSGAGTVATNSPFSSGGYGYYGSQFNAGVGYSGPGGGTSAGLGGGVGINGAPSQDYQEKQALFQQMNDANWEMLLAQVTVNEISRDYQARSNILKTKSDTELNAVRNMRA